MNWEITKQVAAAVIRWLLAAIGLWLVKSGIVDQQTADAWLNEITATLLGLAILSIPLIWKYLNARFHILALIEAVQTEPPADTPREIKQAVADVKAEVKANNTVLSA
jgi:hypothetical protein